MSDIFDRLKAALADRYSIEKEVGAGGMATVYLAEDLKHHRKVAVKVLRAELSETVGPERFVREIEIAAGLTHPHILPLYDSGEADGFLFYVMPYVEGESLRERLAREGELPISDAVRILKEVADALAKAHAQGVVHRDIKPDNVMLADRHALVADFGVAKAISEATGRHAITTAGVALGTPSYMSPEQASADPHIDHRADIYAFGAMAYEMLTGAPPFTGSSPQQILAAHVTEPATPVTTRRATVPAPLADLVMRCLEKKAADRWQSADELLTRLEGIATPSVGMTPTDTRPVSAVSAVSPKLGRRAGMAVAAVALVFIGWFALGRTGGATALDENLVVVLPFRVVGSADQVADLREGMVDLMATFLTGEGGTPMSADPGTVISAWRREVSSDREDLDEVQAIELARSLGAGLVLTGAVVESDARLVLRGSLASVDGRVASVQANVEGPADSALALLPRFVGQLLARTAGIGAEQSANLTASLPALRAYLRGQVEYRSARYSEAVNRFTEALETDTNFALAGVGLVKANGWSATAGGRVYAIGQRAAWRGRDDLGTKDRAIVTAVMGTNGPDPDNGATLLRAREEAVRIAEDRSEAWYFLGDSYMHDGNLLGVDDPFLRAERAFARAVERDSSVAGPLQHLFLLAVNRGDTADIRRYMRLNDAAVGDPVAGIPERWLAGVVLGDTALRNAALALLDTGTIDRPVVQGVALMLPFAVNHISDFREFMARLRRVTVSEVGRERVSAREAFLAWDAGRPVEAAEAARRGNIGPAGWLFSSMLRSGDSVEGFRAYRELEEQVAASGEATIGGRDLCAMVLWQFEHNRFDAIPPITRELRDRHIDRDPTWPPARDMVCADLLEAALAQRRGQADAGQLIDRLDELLLTRPYRPRWENLFLARLLEGEGAYARASAAAGRHEYYLGYMLPLATHLRESGRLAELAGDRDRAIDAYSQYLALRSDPEPSVQPEVDEIRGALARLKGERR